MPLVFEAKDCCATKGFKCLQSVKTVDYLEDSCRNLFGAFLRKWEFENGELDKYLDYSLDDEKDFCLTELKNNTCRNYFDSPCAQGIPPKCSNCVDIPKKCIENV